MLTSEFLRNELLNAIVLMETADSFAPAVEADLNHSVAHFVPSNSCLLLSK